MRIDPKKNTLVCGDNLKWLGNVPDESVDLCYIDPPFFSNNDYEVIWGNGYETRSFGDRFAGGIKHYIEWMTARIELVHQKLTKTGLLFLHCDWHASHRLRVLLEDVFCSKGGQFVNEIVWQRTVAKALMKNRLPSNHDTILVYAKGNKFTWNSEAAFIAYDHANLSEKTDKKYSHRDPDGRRYQLDNLINPNPDRPNLKYEFLGVTRVWRWTKERMLKAYKEGLVVQPSAGAVPRMKRYLDEQRGIPLGDVWSDISPLNSQASERLGYPTQKPEALVRRILEIATNPGDMVLDCFVGGGTTPKVAAETKRRFIVGDVSPVAVRITAERLQRANVGAFVLKNMPSTEDELRDLDGHDFAELVCEVSGWKVNDVKANDKGIDGWDGVGSPVQVKNHVAAAGRPDMQKFYGALASAKKKTGCFVAWEFSKGAMEYLAEVKLEHKVEIRPVKAFDILSGLIIDKKEHEKLERFYAERLPKAWASNDDSEVPDVDDQDLETRLQKTGDIAAKDSTVKSTGKRPKKST